jgi:hypothetical protein
MSLRIPTLMTAGLLGLLLTAGSFATVQAGDSCPMDKKGEKDKGTSTLWCPATTVASQAIPSVAVRP